MSTKSLIAKKITLSNEEKRGLELGNIPSYKKTNTFKRAKKFFTEECEKLKNEGKQLDPKTRMWFDEKDFCFKMIFVLVSSSSNKVLTALDDLIDFFKKDLFKQS